MPTLQIGRKVIPYELRRSATASERRITITPGHIEVLALNSDSDDDVAGFLERKRQWMFNAVREMEQVIADRHAVPRFMTGTKILYRGRKMPLTVRRTDAGHIEVNYQNGFIVDLPHWISEEPDNVVATEIKLWMKQRVRRDIKGIASSYSRRFNLVPRSIRVADMTHGWGSCGAEGNLLINWHLVFAPRQVMEYVVIHELAHLRYRSHDEQFWQFLKTILPDYLRSKSWLEKHGAEMDSSFLDNVKRPSPHKT